MRGLGWRVTLVGVVGLVIGYAILNGVVKPLFGKQHPGLAIACGVTIVILAGAVGGYLGSRWECRRRRVG